MLSKELSTIIGGLPGLLKMGLDEDDAMEYQKDVLNTVLLKDVISRNNIRNVSFLERLTSFIADNVGIQTGGTVEGGVPSVPGL